jgi:pimeloyl-ACP methyl ester carboxylesterase
VAGELVGLRRHQPRDDRLLAEPRAEGIGDARMECIPDAGHCSNLEAPDRFNEALGGFLESVYG